MRAIHRRALHRSTINAPGISSRRYPRKKMPAPMPTTRSLNPRSRGIWRAAAPMFIRSRKAITYRTNRKGRRRRAMRCLARRPTSASGTEKSACSASGEAAVCSAIISFFTGPAFCASTDPSCSVSPAPQVYSRTRVFIRLGTSPTGMRATSFSVCASITDTNRAAESET
jgi:hypothetical protein